MNERQVIEILQTIHLYYSAKFKLDKDNLKELVKAWHRVLKHHDFETINKNLEEYVQTNSFPPTIADLVKKQSESSTIELERNTITKTEVLKILKSIKKYYEVFEYNELTVDVWHEELKGFEYEQVTQAAKSYVDSGNEEPPSLKDIIPKGANRTQIIKILNTIKSYWERFELTEEKIDSWYKALKTYDTDFLMNNLNAHIKDKPYPPTISDLVKQIKSEEVNRVPSVEETKKYLSQMESIKPASKETRERELAKIREVLGIRR